MKEIKVLHVYKTSFPATMGGVEVLIDSLCKGVEPLGFSSSVLSLTKNPSKEAIDLPGYKVFQAKQNIYIASTGFSLAAFFMFRKLVKKVDIIHYHFPNPFGDLLHLFRGVKKPVVVTYHADIVKQNFLLRFYQPLMNWFLRKADIIVATSPNYLASSKVLNKFRKKTEVILIGIDKNEYPKIDKKRKEQWLNKLPKQFLLFVGALRYYKGLHFALEAIAGTDHQLVIAGAGSEEKTLKAKAQNLNLDNVHFVGKVSELDKVILLDLCSGFLFPSHLRSEAFGISLLEAIMYGKPAISSEIATGTSFINKHGETGIVTKKGSVSEIKAAMDALSSDPKKAKIFGGNAEKRYQKYFTAEKQAKAYAKLYKGLLK